MNIKTIKIEQFKNAHHQSDFKGKLIFENDNTEELDFDLHDMTKDFIKMVKEHFNDVIQTINM